MSPNSSYCCHFATCSIRWHYLCCQTNYPPFDLLSHTGRSVTLQASTELVMAFTITFHCWQLKAFLPCTYLLIVLFRRNHSCVYAATSQAAGWARVGIEEHFSITHCSVCCWACRHDSLVVGVWHPCNSYGHIRMGTDLWEWTLTVSL